MTDDPTSNRNPGGRPLAFGGPLAYLVDTFKGEHALAEELATSPRSIRRWGSGHGKPNRASAKLLKQVAARYDISEAELQPILDGKGSVAVSVRK